ncbi:MAG: nitroreductase family protein [Bacteroidales bacterium]|nr:nitroreductase family protein [Bacteroidales bacterium]
MPYSVNNQTCKSCKLCIEVCPCNIIDIDENKKVFFIEKNINACVKCGQCMAVCSTKSISVDGFSYDEDFMELSKEKIEYENFMNFIKQRRSARNYRNVDVPDEIIQKIIHAIEFAPFGSAHNDVHFTVVRTKEKFSESLPIMSEFFNEKIVKWIENPIMRKIIKMKKGEETLNTLVNHLYPIAKSGNYDINRGDRITRDAPVLIIFHADLGAEEHSHNSIIFATYGMIAAHSLGLSATFNGLVPSALNKNSELKNIFEIPKNHDVVTSLMIGYPKYHYQRTIVRKKTNVKFV